ncbi:MAG TPA: beta-ketoacyl synthase N-terminal-like domain-containing protein [Streptosporangiaceae bacterium]|nr:beta-ketoacyl synthase N-terminal-like domain-containing protein [Streptosporangiaceae bacterium]
MSEVAIVGMGAVFPGARDAAAFWHNIRSGVDAITEVPPDRWDPEVYYRPGESGEDRFYCRRGGFIDDLADFDPAPFGIMPAAVPGIEPDQLLMLRAAAEAIADSRPLGDTRRVGVIVGRGGYLTPGVARLDQRVRTAHQLTAVLADLVPGLGAERLDAVRAAFQEKLGPDRAEFSIGLVPNFAASRLANRFDLRGPAYTVDAACASSLVAVDHAVRELASGRCDAVLAGGVHTCHHPTLWSVFTQLKALSTGERIRPFDRGADGTLLSEGAGAVLLKRLADAVAAGDRVYAVIRGVGVASDGRATSMMNPLAEGQELAMRRAWSAAGLDPAAPDALGLLEAHGTATPVGDRVELETLARVFGPSRGAPAGLGTVKSMIGHAMPAAGVAGLIKAALAVHHGVLPPTLNITEPHPALDDSRFEPVARAQPWADDLPRRAAVSAFGFGGINAHVVLEAPAAGSPARSRRTAGAGTPTARPAVSAAGAGASAAGAAGEPVLRLAAGSPRELAEQLGAPDAELRERAGRPPGPGPCRLAIVGPDARRLALARKIAARGTPWRGRSDIWFTPRPLLTGPAQVALLFPGLEPEFTPRTAGVAEHFGLPAPRLRGGDAGARPDGEVFEYALDVIAVGRLFAAALGELGVAPGALTGHSLGEWTAMIVAGIYPEIDAFIASVRPGMAELPDLVYAALGASADRARELIGGRGDMFVTHDNCPRQSVVCGPAAPVDDLVGRARAAGILAQTLPFRTGFHSPMYAPYVAAARETVQRLEVRPPRVPVWSATSVAPYPADPDEVRDLVLRHLVEPVRFRELTRRLHETGVRAFVQAGPGSLTGFTEDTLRDLDFLTVAATVPQRDGLAQLRRVAAALWAHGLPVRIDRLGTAVAGTVVTGTGVTGTGVTGTAVTSASPTGLRLRLGFSPVRLPDSVLANTALANTALASPALAVGTPPATLPGSADAAVLAEFSALMADTAAVAGAVAEALSRPPQAPAPGAAARPGPPGEALTTREFSLLTMPDLADHSIIPQPAEWPDDSDRFPVVPMTALLEVMAEAALGLVPGRVVTGFEKVRAMRWLTLAPATTARVRAVADGPGRVKVRIEGYADGDVLVADTYPVPPPPAAAPLRDERPVPVTARELYSDGWMFHGPRFAGVEQITSMAADGLSGTLVSLPALGALLDSAGQLIGHWIQVSHTADQNVLPTGIGAVRRYGPQPPAGSRLGCEVRIREVTATQMRGDAELQTGDGAVWCRIEDWTTRRFATDEASWRLKLRPGHEVLSRRTAEGWHVLREAWPDAASRDLLMRHYLNAAERARYERFYPLQQRRWLLACMAVKDAVRQWLWDRGAGPVFPVEVAVDGLPGEADGASREPLVRGPFRAPRVSVALCPAGPVPTAPGCAVAIAGAGPTAFTVATADDGTLLVTRPGGASQPVGTVLPTSAAQTAKGQR